MKIKKQIFMTFFTTIFFATPLLKGMETWNEDFLKILYKEERKTLDLNNMNITPKFLEKNRDLLRNFIFKYSVQKLDLQRNGLKQIPVCILKILLEEKSPLKEINIVFPKLSVGVKGLFHLQEMGTIQDYVEKSKLNIQVTMTTENEKSMLTLTKKQ